MLNMETLEELGINTEDGLAYCMDDPEFYEEMLCEYVKEAEARADDLDRFFTAGDWEQYGISAHTIKSTSKMIGAKEMAEFARRMEMAGKQADEAAVRADHEHFSGEVRRTAEELRAAINAEE